jgi:hypothetical protein
VSIVGVAATRLTRRRQCLVVDKGVDEALRMEEKTRDGGNVAKPTVGREEVLVRLELW